MAIQPETMKRKTDTPSLFEPRTSRPIPVGTVSQPAWKPGADEEDDREPVKPAAKDRSEQPPPYPPPTRGRAEPPRPRAARPQRRVTRSRAVTAETLATQQRDISVSEFFAKNRHLLGFDNKRKALLTTVKEAVDNSLDACEEAGLLPELWVTIDQLAEERFRVTVRDNGPGIVKAQIANIFGKLLYGSKFHRLKMARGQQGIGISAAGMYGLLTTGKSVHITSRTAPGKPAHHMQIQMDTAKNRADVIVDEEAEVPWERGTEVVIELVATYSKGRQSVDEYVEQTAIANPHAVIHYISPTPEHRDFPRGTEELPAETREIMPHPHGIELGVLMKMLKDAKPQKRGERSVRLASFLQNEFCRVSSRTAQEICETAKLSPTARAHEIGTHDVEQLYQAMQSVKIMAPPTDCLAPIGVRNLLAGLLKEVKAEFFTATTRDPAVYRGNPFQIEIALAYGGNLPADQPARVIRFANRVPLLYQQSACSAYRSVLDVDWRNYSLSQPSGSLPIGPLVAMIHMASVWVPFTSESKEAIADYDEIRKEMKLALQECGRKLAAYVRRRRRQRMESERRNIFERYIPDVAEALANLTGQNAERLLRDLRAIARHRTAEADVALNEDGRPVAATTGGRSEPKTEARGKVAAGAPPAEADELTGDASTVIVPENEAAAFPDDLFDTNGNGEGKKHRRPRKRA
jgi:DNA topoisomerase-6 subunit B